MRKRKLSHSASKALRALGHAFISLVGNLRAMQPGGMQGAVTLAVRFPQRLKLSWEPWDIVIVKKICLPLGVPR